MADDDIRLLFAGDFGPINRTSKAILDGNSRKMVSDIAKYLRTADLAALNLEAPLTLAGNPIDKIGPCLRADPGCVEFLTESGFGLVNCANNHITDFGDEGAMDTIDVLRRNGLAYIGAGTNLEQASEERVFDIKGRRIAFLAYAENEFSIADEKKAGASPINPFANIRQIEKVSADNDFTVVMVHGGNEYNPVPSPGMIERYRGYVDAGASAVVAGHTHCPQGFEVYNGSPIVYSMGNFLFDTPYSENEYREDDFWWKGYMVVLVIGNPGKTGVEIIPVESGPNGTKVVELNPGKTGEFLAYLRYISDIIADREKVLDYWNAWCVLQGPWWVEYFKNFEFPFDISDRERHRAARVIRNGHTCEAHLEIITTFLRLAATGRTGGYEGIIEKTKLLQRGLIPPE